MSHGSKNPSLRLPASFSVLDELREHYRSAVALLEKLASSLREGDAAPALLRELAALLNQAATAHTQLHGPVPNELRDLMLQVETGIMNAFAQGTQWMESVALPQLTLLTRTQQLLRLSEQPQTSMDEASGSPSALC
jgi:hypothetical protein